MDLVGDTSHYSSSSSGYEDVSSEEESASVSSVEYAHTRSQCKRLLKERRVELRMARRALVGLFGRERDIQKRRINCLECDIFRVQDRLEKIMHNEPDYIEPYGSHEKFHAEMRLYY